MSKVKPELPAWTHGLPNHTLLKSDEVGKMFGVSGGKVARAVLNKSIPPPTEVHTMMFGDSARFWSLGSLRKYINSIL